MSVWEKIEPYRVRVSMKARELGLTQADAASIAEFLARSGQRIEAGDFTNKKNLSRNL